MDIVLTTVKFVICTIVLVAASAFDIKTKKIPNGLTYGAAASGLVFMIVSRILNYIDTKEIIWSVAAIIILIIIMGTVPFIGGGDAKLLMALFLWENPLIVLAMFGLGNLLVGFWYIYNNIILVKFIVRKKIKKEKLDRMGKMVMAPSFAISYVAIYVFVFLRMFNII